MFGLSKKRKRETKNKNDEGKTAIKMAALRGDLDMFTELHEAGAFYHRKKLLVALDEKIKSEPDKAGNFQAIINFIRENTPKKLKKDGERLDVYAYPTSLEEKAQTKELKKQRMVAEQFFRVKEKLDESKKSAELYHEIKRSIDDEKHGTRIVIKTSLAELNLPLITLNNYSARAAVIAISKLLQTYEKFPDVCFKLGETQLLCRANPSLHQIGNLYVEIIGLPNEDTYGDTMIEHLEPLLGKNKKTERERQLAQLLREKSKRLHGFELTDFNSSGRIKLEGEEEYKPDDDIKELQNAIHVLNFLNFMHVIGEVTRRLYRDEKGGLYSYKDAKGTKSDKFPVAPFHARVIELMSLGRIKANDVFGNSGEEFEERPKYGVVAAKKLTDDFTTKVINKANSINKLMSDYHKEKYAKNYSARNPNDYLQTRASLLRTELGNQFGGDSESDGEDYSSGSDTEYLSENEQPIATGSRSVLGKRKRDDNESTPLAPIPAETTETDSSTTETTVTFRKT